MYYGKMVELADSDELFANPLHPYTKMLISSILVPDPRVKSLDAIVPDYGEQKRTETGCKFAPRCPHATKRCQAEKPKLREAEPGHCVACHLYEGK